MEPFQPGACIYSRRNVDVKHKILFSSIGAILLLVATTALVWAWPNQPPERVLISGPGIGGQVEVKDEQARAIFRLGNLEDFDSVALAPAPGSTGYKIVRFFYGGEFDFARLTYYPNPSGGRGYLYFEDGPDLRGDHTAYHQTWLYTTSDGEKQLRGLLTRLGAKLDASMPAARPVSGSASANVNASSSDSTLGRSAADASKATRAQPVAASDLNLSSSTVLALFAGLIGVLGAAGAVLLWRGRRTQAKV
jgi:hypothetical protein